MKRKLEIAAWLSWFLLAGTTPASANNPPAPDGMLLLILVFPIAILANRWAGVVNPSRSKAKRVLLLLVLILAAFLAAAGTMIGALAMVVIVAYGLARGAKAIQLGHGGKRFILGIIVILFSFFSAVNYLVSLNSRTFVFLSEQRGAVDLRNIARAQEQFRSSARVDSDKDQVPEYGTFSQLQEAGLLRPSPSSGPDAAYAYSVVLAGKPDEDEKRFFAYAKPRNFAGAENLGVSLIDSIRSRPRAARLTFAIDETGNLRAADLNGSRDVTREEVRPWPVQEGH